MWKVDIENKLDIRMKVGKIDEQELHIPGFSFPLNSTCSQSYPANLIHTQEQIP